MSPRLSTRCPAISDAQLADLAELAHVLPDRQLRRLRRALAKGKVEAWPHPDGWGTNFTLRTKKGGEFWHNNGHAAWFSREGEVEWYGASPLAGLDSQDPKTWLALAEAKDAERKHARPGEEET